MNSTSYNYISSKNRRINIRPYRINGSANHTLSRVESSVPPKRRRTGGSTNTVHRSRIVQYCLPGWPGMSDYVHPEVIIPRRSCTGSLAEISNGVGSCKMCRNKTHDVPCYVVCVDFYFILYRNESFLPN